MSKKAKFVQEASLHMYSNKGNPVVIPVGAEFDVLSQFDKNGQKMYVIHEVNRVPFAIPDFMVEIIDEEEEDLLAPTEEDLHDYELKFLK